MDSDIVELKLRVPRQLKDQLQQIAKQRKTSLNSLGILLLNEWLERKPNLFSVLFSPIQMLQVNPVLMAFYREMMAAYSKMHFEMDTTTDSFLQNSTRFIQQAEQFITQLCKGTN